MLQNSKRQKFRVQSLSAGSFLPPHEGLHENSKENVPVAQQRIRAFDAPESLQVRGNHYRQKKSEKIRREPGRWAA